MGHTSDQEEQTVGVVLVHGVGRQKSGESKGKFVRALSRAYRKELPTVDEGNATVVGLPGRSVRLYEACWADALTDEAVAGSFSPMQAFELAWFPWLNLRAHLYESSPRVRVLIWTVVLVPAAIGLFVLWLIAKVAAACLRLGSRLSGMFDEVVADVLNYVNSAGHATVPDSPLRDAASIVDRRFVQALDRAASDGCTCVHVVAHSLGTVIATRQLFGGEPPTSRDLVARLYTIGSPVRRVRFLWPRLFENLRAAPRLEWINYWDPLDLISSRLSPTIEWAPVDDVALAGRAGLGRAHLAYVAHPRFIRRFADGIGAEPPPERRHPAGTLVLAAVSLLESVCLLLAVLVALIMGLLLCIVAAVLIAFFDSVKGVAESGASGDPSLVRVSFLIVLPLVMIVYYLLIPIGYGRFKAGYSHYRHLYRCEPRLARGEATPSAEQDDEEPIWAWLGNPSRPWNAGLPGPIRFAVRGLIGLAVYGLGVLVGLSMGIGVPWAGDLAPGVRALAAVGELLVGGIAAFMLVGLIVTTSEFVVALVRAYNDWRRATSIPPIVEPRRDESP
jgi:hypothetical protein